MSSERVLEKIKSEINSIIPANAKITSVEFEGSEVAIYSKNLDVLLDQDGLISQIARTIRKRVVIRSDPEVRLPEDEVINTIQTQLEGIVTIGDIYFDDSLGEVVIHVDKPSKVTSKSSDIINTLTRKTRWRPHFLRIPPLDSSIIRSVRNVLATDTKERKEALRKIGNMVHRESLLDQPIIRITALGGYLEIGRSSTLLQTGDSNVLIDCGVSVGSAQSSKMLPRFDLPEFEISNLDAVVISHAHLDHCLPGDTPVLLSNGDWVHIEDVVAGDKVKTINWKTGEFENHDVLQRTKTFGHKNIREITLTYQNIEASLNHTFFIGKDLVIQEIKADNLKVGDLLPIYDIHVTSTKAPCLLNTKTNYNGRIKLTQELKSYLRKIRLKLKLSQATVADEIGIQSNTISTMENRGNFMTYKIFNRLLKQYRLNYDQLSDNFTLPIVPKKLSSELAMLVGYIQGDGTKNGDYSIRITEVDKTVIKTYCSIIKRLFHVTPIVRLRKDTTSICYYIEINSKLIVDFLEQNFSTVLNKSLEIDIPKNIETSSDDIVCGYLKGLFDAEGSAIPSVKFTSYCHMLTKKVHNLLFRLGIKSAYHQTDHSIRINSKSDQKRFVDIIGFSSIIKQKKLLYRIKERKDTLYVLRDLIPVTAIDFKQILENIGYIGRARGGSAIAKLPIALLDLYRRDTGHITRSTGRILVEFLLNRYAFLQNIIEESFDSISDLRKSLSLTLNQLSHLSGLTVMQLQHRERGYEDEKNKFVLDLLSSSLNKILAYIETTLIKIQKIINLDVKWFEIKSIEDKKNTQPLYDILVDQNHNFISNNVIVHNCGFVPFLLKYGYEGPIYTTSPTRDLMTMLQIDYLDIAEKEGKLKPYTKNDIRKATLQTITMNYGDVTDIAPGVKLTLHNAGHILGSAIIHLHIGNGKYNLAFAHDFKFENSRLLDKSVFKFPRLETMIMEGTYGNPKDITPSRSQSEYELSVMISDTIKRGGKVLMPVLAVGRAQELQLVIEHLMRTKKIPSVPVYVEGMIKEATAVTTNHPEFLSRQLREKIFGQDTNPFLSEIFHPISSLEEREKVIYGDSCVIMATSGMLVGGPSVYYFNALAENEKNSIIFVSYQGKGSLGRKVSEGASEVTTKNDQGKTIAIKINMSIHQVTGFTGHSDRRELMEFAKRLYPRPKQFLIVHGEASKCQNLAKSISRLVKREAFAPPVGTTIRLEY